MPSVHWSTAKPQFSAMTSVAVAAVESCNHTIGRSFSQDKMSVPKLEVANATKTLASGQILSAAEPIKIESRVLMGRRIGEREAYHDRLGNRTAPARTAASTRSCTRALATARRPRSTGAGPARPPRRRVGRLRCAAALHRRGRRRRAAPAVRPAARAFFSSFSFGTAGRRALCRRCGSPAAACP